MQGDVAKASAFDPGGPGARKESSSLDPALGAGIRGWENTREMRMCWA